MGKSKGGRPARYKKECAVQAVKLCRLGATNADLADFFSVVERTIERWTVRYPEFCRALKVGKDEADNRVERSLYQKATGYSHPDIHISVHQGKVIKTELIKHYPPDTTACIFWLKNRQPAAWRDRHEYTGADGGPILTADLTGKEACRLAAYFMQRDADAEELH